MQIAYRPLLLIALFLQGCCVGVATEVRNDTGRDILLTTVDDTGQRASTAVPAGATRICGGIFNLGKAGRGRYSWLVFDGQSQVSFADVSQIGGLPDAFKTNSYFTSMFPCLRITAHVKLSSDMMIYAVGAARREISQPAGFPIHGTPIGSVVELNAIANDPNADHAERARAIFTLFANYVHPGQSADGIHHALTATTWLEKASIHGFYTLAGEIPIEMNADSTAFCIHLFSEKEEWREWVVYFSLSNAPGVPYTKPRTEQEALSFLRGDTTLAGNPKILEFALCFPAESANQTGRIQRFGQ